MVNIPNLTPYAQTCLELLLARFPQFEPYVRPSDYDEGAWYAELPWPDGWEAVSLSARTHGGPYGEEFRIDIGNTHGHFGDYSGSGSFEFLKQAFELIDDFLNERLVLIVKWIERAEYVGQIEEPTYTPTESDWAEHNVLRIWRRSWHGKHNREWQKEA
jgi:hypothetical protein